jgi:hypothetical protein
VFRAGGVLEDPSASFFPKMTCPFRMTAFFQKGKPGQNDSFLGVSLLIFPISLLLVSQKKSLLLFWENPKRPLNVY